MRIFGDLLSGNCLKVKYTADHLCLAYDWVPIDVLSGESRTQDFLRRSPLGQVPVVEFDDGRALAQSNGIIRYLALGTSLLPTDPFARAKVDEVLFWEQNSHELFIAGCRFQMVYLGLSKGERDPDRVKRGEAALDTMERLICGRRWFVGNAMTVADIALLAYTRLAHEGGFDLALRPQVQGWIGRVEKELRLSPVTPRNSD